MNDLIEKLRPVHRIVDDYDRDVAEAGRRAEASFLALGFTATPEGQPLAGPEALPAPAVAEPLALPAPSLPAETPAAETPVTARTTSSTPEAEPEPAPSEEEALTGAPDPPAEAPATGTTETVTAPQGYQCPRCGEPGRKHHYFHMCLACAERLVATQKERRADTMRAKALKQMSGVDSTPRVPEAAAHDAHQACRHAGAHQPSPTPPQTCVRPAPESGTKTMPPRPFIPTAEANEVNIQAAIALGKQAFSESRRFDIHREAGTGRYFTVPVSEAPRENMRAVLRVWQLGNGTWQECRLGVTGKEVGA
jgi:hypothetical protein